MADDGLPGHRAIHPKDGSDGRVSVAEWAMKLGEPVLRALEGPAANGPPPGRAGLVIAWPGTAPGRIRPVAGSGRARAKRRRRLVELLDPPGRMSWRVGPHTLQSGSRVLLHPAGRDGADRRLDGCLATIRRIYVEGAAGVYVAVTVEHATGRPRRPGSGARLFFFVDEIEVVTR